MRQNLAGVIDSELVLRVQAAGDHAAYGELVRRHQGALRAFLWRLAGNAAVADDLAQDALIKGYDGIASFRGQATFRSWLFAIAYRGFLRGRRKAVRYARALNASADAAAPPPGVDPDTALDLQRLLLTLRVEERAALLLCDACGLSHSEAAAAMALPLGTLKTYVQRARGKMRVALETPEDIPCRIA
ncbi:MAG: RNA polymerase sigma factor [Alphaproteobacteria bacterium]|nr:RNA polymerase sigma factor [Alphaproteobacteria bacterium]